VWHRRGAIKKIDQDPRGALWEAATTTTMAAAEKPGSAKDEIVTEGFMLGQRLSQRVGRVSSREAAN